MNDKATICDGINLETAVGRARVGRHGDALARRDNDAGYCLQGGAIGCVALSPKR